MRAKDEPRPAQDDAKQRNHQRHKERAHEEREGRGEDVHQPDQQKDQPDVIGLPHRPKNLADKLVLAPGGRAGGQ